jgi:hypothetical protein
MKHLLATCGILVINHPLYSPNLVPADCFLLLKVKTALEGRRFQDIENMKNVTTELE